MNAARGAGQRGKLIEVLQTSVLAGLEKDECVVDKKQKELGKHKVAKRAAWHTRGCNFRTSRS